MKNEQPRQTKKEQDKQRDSKAQERKNRYQIRKNQSKHEDTKNNDRNLTNPKSDTSLRATSIEKQSTQSKTYKHTNIAITNEIDGNLYVDFDAREIDSIEEYVQALDVSPKKHSLSAENQKEQKLGGGFAKFNLRKFILQGIQALGFSTPSPIQEKSIPIVLRKKDLIAQAQTGTGKTAAFAISILNMIDKSKDCEALIITPTRELAMQISDEFLNLGRFARIKTICMYGGQSIKRQCELLKNNPKIMIATPGRLLDHLQNGRLGNFLPKFVVLDESDEMLDMGFLEDIEKIFSYLPTNRQTLLFSATMPEPIKKLAMNILNNPEFVKITPVNITNQDIEQKYYVINESERDEAIVRLLEINNPTKSIIFTRTKKEADLLANRLKKLNFNVLALHGDMEQRDRRVVIKAFKEDRLEILVATDVASRGLDISNLSHVFNYHIPLNPESYVHRIGRTGRAGKKGIAITLVTPLEFKEINQIKKSTKADIELCEIDSKHCISGDELLEQISSIKVLQDAKEQLQILKYKMSEEELQVKLLSFFMRTKNKNIGFNKEEISKIQAQSDGNLGEENRGTRAKFHKNNSKTHKNNRSDRHKNERNKHSNKGRNNKPDRFKEGNWTDSIWS